MEQKACYVFHSRTVILIGWIFLKSILEQSSFLLLLPWGSLLLLWAEVGYSSVGNDMGPAGALGITTAGGHDPFPGF